MLSCGANTTIPTITNDSSIESAPRLTALKVLRPIALTVVRRLLNMLESPKSRKVGDTKSNIIVIDVVEMG